MGELTRLMLRLSLVQHRVWSAAGWVSSRTRSGWTSRCSR